MYFYILMLKVRKNVIFAHPKVSFFGMCSKMQIIPIKNLNIKKVVPQFLWFFRLKCWFKGQIISRIHLSLLNAYKLMCFDRNIIRNRDVKFLRCDYLLVRETHFSHWMSPNSIVGCHMVYNQAYNLILQTKETKKPNLFRYQIFTADFILFHWIG